MLNNKESVRQILIARKESLNKSSVLSHGLTEELYLIKKALRVFESLDIPLFSSTPGRGLAYEWAEQLMGVDVMNGQYKITGRIVLESDKSVGVDVTVIFDKSDVGFEEVKYHHIMTGQPCQSIEMVFAGWSEISEEATIKWELLRDSIRGCDLLVDWFASSEATDIGTLTISEHGELSKLNEGV